MSAERQDEDLGNGPPVVTLGEATGGPPNGLRTYRSRPVSTKVVTHSLANGL